MAIAVSDFPRKEYAGHFEFVPGDGDAVTARVYPDGDAPKEFTGSPEDAERFVVSAMAALKKGV